jgi:hypothetical protein
MFTW